MIEPKQSITSQPAVIPTRPASDALRHIETSGLPYLSHVKIIQVTVATAGATVVVRKIESSCETLEAAAGLKPYQPNQRIKQPRAPIVRLCPGIAFTLISPSLVLTNLPIRGPTILAPIRAQIPPTMWIAHEPERSWKPI